MVTILKQAGEQVSDNLAITIEQDEIEYEIKEDQDKIPHEITSDEKKKLADYEGKKERDGWAFHPRIRKYDHPYNGHLRIRFLVSGSSKHYLKDRKIPLEGQLLDIIANFYKIYLETKHAQGQREKWEHERELEEQQNQQREQQIADEKQRVLTLINETKDYQLANVVRHYAVAVKQTEADSTKVAWMQSVANWLDPLVSGENPYLEKRQHGDSDEKKASYLGEETTSSHNSFIDYLNML